MRDVRQPGITEKLTYAHYLRELEARPPDVIFFGDEHNPLFPQQQAAVRRFIRDHRYERRVIGRDDVFVPPAALARHR